MKPNDHERITKKAVHIFYRYTQSDFSSMLFLHRKHVEHGAMKEDAFPVHDRITNWHFFKQNRQLCPTTVYYCGIIPLAVTPTSEIIVARRVAQLKSALKYGKYKQICELVGRVLHHIQDMSTPAHVVPVYHGPCSHDSFEKYSTGHSRSELQTIDISAQEYTSIHSENNDDIMSIYSDAAYKTLRYLYDDPAGQFEIGNGELVGWDLFWKRPGDTKTNCVTAPYAKIPGFGCYGPLGKKYGTLTAKLNGTYHKIDHGVYRNMHRWVLHKQIKDSLRTLLSIDTLQK